MNDATAIDILTEAFQHTRSVMKEDSTYALTVGQLTTSIRQSFHRRGLARETVMRELTDTNTWLGVGLLSARHRDPRIDEWVKCANHAVNQGRPQAHILAALDTLEGMLGGITRAVDLIHEVNTETDYVVSGITELILGGSK